MAAPDASKIVSGPAQFLLASAEIGHTQGAITSTFSPQNRGRNVDEFGASEVAIIHNGDTCRLTVPFAEWAADTLAEIYDPGNDQTEAGASGSGGTYLGFGRAAGYVYQTQEAQIIPRLAAAAQKFLQFWKVTPIGEFQLTWNAETDRIFETEFACLTDETQTDGELIGRIQL